MQEEKEMKEQERRWTRRMRGDAKEGDAGGERRDAGGGGDAGGRELRSWRCRRRRRRKKRCRRRRRYRRRCRRRRRRCSMGRKYSVCRVGKDKNIPGYTGEK